MSTKWVTFTIGRDVFGVSIANVREMVAMMPTRTVPRQPSEQIGVAILRNEVIPVMDSRRLLGITSEHPSKELVATLEARKQDHVNWLTELERSVAQGTDFGLTLDPTQCKFGKWFSSFKADDQKIRLILQQTADPHAKIHQVGRVCIDLVKEGRQEEAIRVINENRETTLKRLFNLLDEVCDFARETSRQVVVVLKGHSGLVGLAVDALQSVVQIEDEEIQDPKEHSNIPTYEAVCGYWVNPRTGSITRLLDAAVIYPTIFESAVTEE